MCIAGYFLKNVGFFVQTNQAGLPVHLRHAWAELGQLRPKRSFSFYAFF
jgi:hypothetical protein